MTGETPKVDRRVRGDVAIIGMAALFPGAPDLTTYWQNILGKVDAVTDAPPEAWDASVYFDPTSSRKDRVYCQRGGYLGPIAYFNPLEHGVMPRAVEGGEPDQWLALGVARAALQDAGYLDHLEVRHRTSVVIGKGTYINRGNLSMVQHGVMVEQTLDIIRSLHPEFDATALEAIRRELTDCLPPFTTETVPGLIPNIIAGRIANRLDLMGPSYTIDAACASSLIAVQVAMRDLLTDECDLALVGGAQVTTPIPILSLFCQLNALSRRQQIRPFDKDADGTILGEGVGMVVLKRRDDAERDGDRIYAVIKGVGTASDGRAVSVMAPRIEGEELALRRAYEIAGVDPASVELLEAHGTGTLAGDAAELDALARVFGAGAGAVPHCALGTVKSMIGHTMPAAGIAGVIKAALALYHKVLPPTLNVAAPNPHLAPSMFYLNTEVRPWAHGGDQTPRRAGVNAFGFGGINAHAVLEEHTPPTETTMPTHQVTWETEALVLQADSRDALVAEVERVLAFLAAGPAVALKDLAYTLNLEQPRQGCRLAVVAATLDDLRQKLERARGRLVDPKCKQIKDKAGVYYFAEPLGPQGKLAVLFPGEGAQYSNMLADLCVHFPEVRAAFDQMDRVFWNHPRGYRCSDFVFPPALLPGDERAALEQRLWQIEGAVEAILTANHGLHTLMSRLGLQPDVVVGHSTGEYSAMRAAGVMDMGEEAVFARFIRALNRGYQEAVAVDGVPPAAMLAVGADCGQVAGIAARVQGELYVAMDNCPHQAVIVGEQSAVEQARALVQEQGWIYEFLTFDRAYHTPAFAPYTEYLRQAFSTVPIGAPRLPIYSCTTAEPYPTDPAEILHLMIDHWVRPVEFRRTVEELYADGVRIFVEVGPRGNLTAFVEDILRGRPYCAVPVNVQHRSGITQLNHCVALLTAHGVDLDLAPLYARRSPRAIAWDGDIPTPAARGVKLPTGFAVLRLSPALAQELRKAPATLQEHPPAPAAVPAAPAAPVLPRPEPAAAPRPVPPAFEAPALDEASEHAAPIPELVPEQPAPEVVVLPAAPAAIDGVGADDSSDAAMLGYLESMDRFLAVQDQVMRAFLTAGSAAFAEPAPGMLAADPLDDGRVTSHAASELTALTDTLTAAPLSVMDARAGVRFPLLGAVVASTPGQELVTRRTFDPAEDLYLRDHTLGRAVSDTDPGLLALAVMPLTMSLEIMAEAAACLLPGRTVIGMRDIRAFRWIAFDDQPQTLEMTARIVQGSADRVVVQVRNLTEDARTAPPLKSPVLEATVLVAPSYAPAPAPQALELPDARPSRWSGDRLYREAMFHGPRWQGVAAIERTAGNGTVAALPVLPFSSFLRSSADPCFELDPVVLDAAGQVIGFWTMEHLTTGRMIFPYRVASLDIYGPQRACGEMITCTAAVSLVGQQQVTSDIDMIGSDGRLWMRLTAWEDKRFDVPADFHRHLLDPRHGEAAGAWPEPLARLPHSARYQCRRASGAFSSDRGFWKLVWAHCILSKAERAQFRRLDAPESAQLAWLAARAAAKEAVRQLVRAEHGRDLLPADIELDHDDHGRLVVGGAWCAALPGVPRVSVAQAGEEAVALAAPADAAPYVGIQIGQLGARSAAVSAAVFTGDEESVLERLPATHPEERRLLGWCAKEAVARALGFVLAALPGAVVITAVDATQHLVTVRLRGPLAAAYPELAPAGLVVSITRRDDLVVATTICDRVSDTEPLVSPSSR